MIKKSSHKGFIIGITAALLLPISFYIIVRVLSKDTLKMPRYYIADHIDSQVVDGKMQYDTTFHKVSDFELTNQLGDRVTLNGDLKGKIVVVDFFFISCSSICPKLTGNMKILQRAFKKNDTTVHLLSVSVNPEEDTVEALRAYADKYEVNHDHWWFLTGDRKVVYNLARNDLGLSIQPANGGLDDLIHSEKLVLIDKDRYIRGYYNGLDTAELKRCADDIGMLSLEKKRKKKK